MTRPRDPFASPTIPLGICALVALLWGWRAESPDAIALAIALIALLATAFQWARIGANAVVAHRAVAPRAFEDERIEVRFSIDSTSPLALVGLEVADHFPADRVPEKHAIVFPSLPPRSRVESQYHADCDTRRGLYAVGPLSIVASDPLGLFRTRRTLDNTLDALLVYPQVLPLARLPLASGGVRYDAAAAILGGLPGAGIEFLGTRDHRPGDPLRAVHWPSSARMGRLIVKELEETAAADTAIFLDLARLSVRGLGRPSTLELSIRVAASVASYAARGPNRVRLHARASKPVYVPPGSGTAHLALILETLALVKPDGDVPFTQLLRETAPTLSRGSTAVAIFAAPETDLSVYADVLAHYRAHGVRLLAVLVDAMTFVKLYDEQVAVEAAAHGLRAEAAALAAQGASVVTIARGEDIVKRFEVPITMDATVSLETDGDVALEGSEGAAAGGSTSQKMRRPPGGPAPQTRRYRPPGGRP